MSIATKEIRNLVFLGHSGSWEPLSKIISEVPLAELKDFGSSLRFLTHGKAKFKLEFNNYQLVPPHIQESLVISNAVLSEV